MPPSVQPTHLAQIGWVWGFEKRPTVQFMFPLCSHGSHRRRHHREPCQTRAQRVLHDRRAFCQQHHGLAQVLRVCAITLGFSRLYCVFERLFFRVRHWPVLARHMSCCETGAHVCCQKAEAILLAYHRLVLVLGGVHFRERPRVNIPLYARVVLRKLVALVHQICQLHRQIRVFDCMCSV